jgi:hypothetical protein
LRITQFGQNSRRNQNFTEEGGENIDCSDEAEVIDREVSETTVVTAD